MQENNKSSHGGARKGAGKKGIPGLKKRTYRTLEIEDQIIKRWLKKRHENIKRNPIIK